jgi:RNA polymerase sigma factor (sigma-70 family)
MAAELHAAFTVYVVDDDPAVRDSLSLLLGLRGYRTALFACAEDFLNVLDPEARGCLVVDVKMPGMSGLDLQREIGGRGLELPVIVITAHGDVASARAALRADAVDFLEKPFDDLQLTAAIDAAFERERNRWQRQEEASRREARLASLSAREREVMVLMARGMHNRDIAEALAISPRTVEIHKARVLNKLQIRNLADLIRLAGVTDA